MKFVNFKALITILFVCLVFIISQTSQVSAISVKELLGLDKPAPEAVPAKKPKTDPKEPATTKPEEDNWAETADKEATLNPQIDLDYISLLIANMNEKERAKILADQDLFKQVIESEAKNRATLSAAIANKLTEDRNVEFLMRRGAENILRESYLSRLIASKLPRDFPNDEQVSE